MWDTHIDEKRSILQRKQINEVLRAIQKIVGGIMMYPLSFLFRRSEMIVGRDDITHGERKGKLNDK